MKKLWITLTGLLVLNSGFGQDCSTDPSKFSGHVVSGQFAIMGSGDDEFNDVVMLNNQGSIMSIDVLKGNVYDQRVLEKNVNSYFYNLNNVNGRIVSGDFNRDGLHNDFALIYKLGSNTMRIDVFTSDNSSSPSFTKSTYLTLTGYNPDKVTGRIVSGDFDRDGKWDDIAMFYDYGGGQTRIHMFNSTGSSFTYGGSPGWWSSLGYNAPRITDRVVSGDFDRDGKEDDIAVFYDYGGGQTRIHVFQSTGSSFTYSGSTGWWISYGYNASQISGRVVSVNINRDNKIFDDIAVFYDYGGGQTRMHVFESNGSSFSYSGASGWWSSYGYTASKITHKVVAIDTHSGLSGGKISDVLAIYDYGPSTNKYHIWRADNPWFSDPFVTYSRHNFCSKKSAKKDNIVRKEETTLIDEQIKIVGYPNPTTGVVTIDLNSVPEEGVTVEIYTITGELIYQEVVNTRLVELNLAAQPNGIYIVNVKSSIEVKKIKIVKK